MRLFSWQEFTVKTRQEAPLKFKRCYVAVIEDEFGVLSSEQS